MIRILTLTAAVATLSLASCATAKKDCTSCCAKPAKKECCAKAEASSKACDKCAKH